MILKLVKNKKMKKRGQVWIETVIYTLIGLSIIAILLAVLKPVIQEKQDQIVIEQSIDMLNQINEKVNDVLYYGVGNSRTIDIKIKTGQLTIDPYNENIVFSMKSDHKYSEIDQEVSIGKIIALTEESGKVYNVSLILYYNLDITHDSGNLDSDLKKYTPAPTPYRVIVTNNGDNIDFK